MGWRVTPSDSSLRRLYLIRNQNGAGVPACRKFGKCISRARGTRTVRVCEEKAGHGMFGEQIEGWWSRVNKAVVG